MYQKDGFGKDRFSFVIVEDMEKVCCVLVCSSYRVLMFMMCRLKEGAFDGAVSSVEAVLHTASPVTTNIGDPQGTQISAPGRYQSAWSSDLLRLGDIAEVIAPALRGTKGILESVRKHGTSVKRFIFTSSFATVYEDKPVLDEVKSLWLHAEFRNGPNYRNF